MERLVGEPGGPEIGVAEDELEITSCGEEEENGSSDRGTLDHDDAGGSRPPGTVPRSELVISTGKSMRVPPPSLPAELGKF